MNQEVYHIPALLPESLSALDIRPGGIYVDATLGGGGHSRAIAAMLGDGGRLYSFDQDADAIERAFTAPGFTPIHGNFRFMANYLDYYGVLGRVDGILADLGVSSHHFDDASRSAADIVAGAEAAELARLFKIYGELPQARRLADAIVKARNTAPVDTTGRLVEVVSPLVSRAKEKKELAQVFQALRIAVNGEMDALESFLNQCVEALRPGGRLAVITYHSLEDRMVKNFMRTGRTDGHEEKDLFGRSSSPMKPLGSKPIVPTDDEVERNPRSRSAKLRVATKL